MNSKTESHISHPFVQKAKNNNKNIAEIERHKIYVILENIDDLNMFCVEKYFMVDWIYLWQLNLFWFLFQI